MRYKIGQTVVELDEGGLPVLHDEMVGHFLSTDPPDVTFTCVPTDLSFLKQARVLKRTGGYELMQTDRGLFLLNHWAMCRFGYGVWLDELDGETKVYYSPDLLAQQCMTVNHLLSTIGMHHKLLQKQAVTLHASYIAYQDRAILFLGPSGTGKSTQAELWNRYAGTEIVNGDRVLLQPKDGTWYAHGFPCCGSSRICMNRSLPLGAIVVLRQAQENRIEALSPAQKLRALTTASEFYPWDNGEVDMVFSIADEVAKQRVLQLSCRPDAEAVKVLKDYLEANL